MTELNIINTIYNIILYNKIVALHAITKTAITTQNALINKLLFTVSIGFF